MKRTEASIRALGRLMGGMEVSREDGMVVLLLLETEEDMQRFLLWLKSQSKNPTGQECFEKAVEISGLMEEPEAED